MRHLDVLDHCKLFVPLGHLGVCCSQDACAGIQLADDAGFSNGQSLLLLVEEGRGREEGSSAGDTHLYEWTELTMTS